jgi:hypothetical protein
MTKLILRASRIAALGIVLAGLLAGTAQAQTTIIEPMGSHFPYQRWTEEARVPTPTLTVTLLETTTGCEEALGCAGPEEIELMAPIAGEATFFHELGHVTAYHFPELAPFEDEQFADAYSLCARVRRVNREWEYTVGGKLMPGSVLESWCRRIRATVR